MPIPVWPDFLPVYALYDGCSFSPHEPYQTTPFETGASRTRALTSPSHGSLSFKTRWKTEDFEAFQRFYHVDLENGTFYFTMPIIVNRVYVPSTVRFKEIYKVADEFNAPIYKRDSVTGVETLVSGTLGANTPYRDTENENENFTPVGGITTHRNNGRVYSPNFTGSTNRSQSAEIISYQEDGNVCVMSKNYLDGSYNENLLIYNDGVRPGKTGMTLGTTAFPWNRVRTEELILVNDSIEFNLGDIAIFVGKTGSPEGVQTANGGVLVDNDYRPTIR